MLRKTVFTAALGCLLALPSQGQFGEIMKNLGLDQQPQLSDDTVVSGLKEALQIGSEKTMRPIAMIAFDLAPNIVRTTSDDENPRFNTAMQVPTGTGDRSPFEKA